MNAARDEANSGSRAVRLAALALAVAAVIAYANSFTAPFVFDDDEAIVNNPSIQRLWPLTEVLFGGQDAGMTGHGRPMLNFTLALNHAISGDAVWSYHIANWLIHAAAGLVLFGLVRRTLAARAEALPVGFIAALLWLVHPLQTESVTYVVQRAESLAGLFCLLTLYGFVRSTGAAHSRRWRFFSVTACLLGMATKESVAVVPLLVLLQDRTLVAGSFRGAWAARRIYYLALAATWLPLAALVWQTGGRGDSAGFGSAITPWTYLLTQCEAIVHYLRLIVWPHPLVLDYGTATVTAPSAVWPQALLLVTLAGATGWALVRRPVWGFIGTWFFLTLAPSSSFVPVATQTVAEHRMYLALAAPAVLVAIGLGRRAWWVGTGIAAALMAATFARNADYASRLTIWEDTVAKRPNNSRAHNNLGVELSAAGRSAEAMRHYEQALRLEPNRTDARSNLANELLRLGRAEEAIGHYEKGLRMKPDDMIALGNLGVALMQSGRLEEARVRYMQLLAIDPDDVSAHANLGYILLQTGHPAAALPHYARAAELQPSDATARLNLAIALLRAGSPAEAKTRCDEALRLDPKLEAARQLRAQLGEAGR